MSRGFHISKYCYHSAFSTPFYVERMGSPRTKTDCPREAEGNTSATLYGIPFVVLAAATPETAG